MTQDRRHIREAMVSSPYLWVAVAIVAKLALVRFLVLGDVNVARALLLEFGFVLLLLLPAEALSDKPLRWHLLLDTALTVLLGAVVMYFRYSNRVVTPEALGMLGNVGDVSASLEQLFTPVLLLLFADVIVLAVLWLWPRSPVNREPLEWPIVGRLGLVTLALCAGALVWGFSTDIASSTTAAREQGLIVFEIKHAWAARQMRAQAADVSDVTDLRARIAELKGDAFGVEEQPRHFGEAKGMNVVFVLAESLQSFPVGLKVDGQQVTPHLDELREESYYFPRVIQQIGAGGTSDAEFVAHTSLYPLESEPVTNRYADRTIPSLPRRLRESGYRAITLHANDVTFWNRDELYPALGFEKAYDKAYFQDAERVLMGASDIDLMRTSAKLIAEEHRSSGKPVYASIVTLTSHHPFNLPPKHRRLDLPPRFSATLSADYLQSVRYLDEAIGMLAGELDKQGMGENTVIVVMGDHFGLQRDRVTDEDLAVLRDVLGHDYNVTERFTVPLMIRVPGLKGQQSESVLGQVDMMPTLLNLLGVDTDRQVLFGHDALNSDGNLVGVRYHLPTGAFATDEVLVEPKRGLKDATVYDVEDGSPSGQATRYSAQHKAVIELERLSDAYLESLPVRTDGRLR